MRSEVSILYRGPLSSCNYDCHYCPFAKRHENADELLADKNALERFVEWASGFTKEPLSVFFTPWGEALTRRWYHSAVKKLSGLPMIRKVAVQTNLSWPMEWLRECDVTKLGFWCTYHPTQVRRAEFLAKCEQLRELGVSHSVGMVAIPADYNEIEAMRAELPSGTYLWLNAFDTGDGRKYVYDDGELSRLLRVDPLFMTNTVDYPSLGQVCHSGSAAFSVSGDGTVRRCHFVQNRLGSIYDLGWAFPSKESTCPNQTCGCHIGYVHMPHLQQARIYGRGLLERVPSDYVSFSAPESALTTLHRIPQ